MQDHIDICKSTLYVLVVFKDVLRTEVGIHLYDIIDCKLKAFQLSQVDRGDNPADMKRVMLVQRWRENEPECLDRWKMLP